jgi:hypothetical protein
MLPDRQLSDDLRSIVTAATIGVAALVVGASFGLRSQAVTTPHSARAGDWQVTCHDNCQLRTMAREGLGEGQWIGLVYLSSSDARVVASGLPLGAAVTFNDGRRFIFDFCDKGACRLPPGDSAALLQRLATDSSGTLRARLADSGNTGLIDLPRLRRTAMAALETRDTP